MQACGTILFTVASGVPLLLCGCILFGLGVGNLVTLPPLIIQKEFPVNDVGRAVALTVAINQAVFAFAPAAIGVLRDIEGNYTVPFAIIAGIQLAASLLVIAYRAE
jgi:cyanate permease